MAKPVVEVDVSDLIGQRIRLYRNLNNHKMSIQTKIPGKGWRVYGYSSNLALQTVEFVVSEKSRQRCLREKCRNVHAYATGTVVEINGNTPISLGYNPYFAGYFFDKERKTAIYECETLRVIDNAVYVSADAIAVVPPSLSSRVKILLFPSQFQILSLDLGLAGSGVGASIIPSNNDCGLTFGAALRIILNSGETSSSL